MVLFQFDFVMFVLGAGEDEEVRENAQVEWLARERGAGRGRACGG